jgi:DNA repair exonuclease SbcCD ATPase subunit
MTQISKYPQNSKVHCEFVSQKEDLQIQIEAVKEAEQRRNRKLGLFKEEVRFQNILFRHRKLLNKKNDMSMIKDKLEELVNLRESIYKIHTALYNALIEELGFSLSPINQALSESFVALTQHPTYNLAFVDKEILPKLELKVGSTLYPDRKWDDSVLNGQAASALGLVPYFAFSQLTDMLFEIHVMLLDDPTQSFDRKHIETLVEKLSQIGQNVQLIVSSHESSLFTEFIPRYFPSESYNLITLNQFSIDEGPKL